MSERVELMGCPLDRITMDEAADRAASFWRSGRDPRTVITVNAALLVAMRNDAGLLRACRAGNLVVADGVPVVWASRVAGTPLPGRVAGIDLMAKLLELASKERLSVFFLGAREEVVRALSDRCAARYPGLRVAGFANGYFPRSSEPRIIERIRRSGASVLFVGMPSPFKETWCEDHRSELGVPVIMGVGGSFDVLAGFIPRAPRLMQGLGLEWLWRLAMEPRRLWKRYLVTNAIFTFRALIGALPARRRSTASS